MCTEAGPHLCGPLQRAFEEVIVGQFYDFELSHEPIHEHVVSDTRYMLMTEKKTGALMGISAEAGGILAHVETKERTNLRDFGRLLGVAFQIADDYASVWSTHEETHKDEHSDIREKKRTLPFLIAYAEVMKKDRLRELYSLDRQLTEDERIEVKTIIDTTPAQGRVIREISLYADRAAEVVQSLSIPDDMKASLAAYAHSLVPTQGAA